MKKVFIILSILALTVESGYPQENITNKPFMIPLKIGQENPPVQFETLYIEPKNLYVQPKPRDDRSPHIQLELEVTENDKQYSTFLTYSENRKHFESFIDPYNGELKTNYPIAFGNYVFGLKINNDSVSLTVDKNDFGKDFFLTLGQKAVIGNISILFEDYTIKWYIDQFDNYKGHCGIYTVLVSDGNEQEKIKFIGYTGDRPDELQSEWKNYQFLVLATGENILKLKVLKVK